MFCSKTIREDFPAFKNNPHLIYLDSAATTFKPQSVIDTVTHYYTHTPVNIGRGEYDLSFDVEQKFQLVRKKTAEFLNAESADEIVFTSGASESLNLIAYGYGMKILKKGDVILTSAAEHASNLLPWYQVAAQTGAKIEFVELNPDGSFNLHNFKQAMNSKVKIVTLAHVSNVLGYVLPIKEIVEIAHRYGAKVAVDGAQSVPHMPVNVLDLNVDFLAFSGHKMLAPTGVGVLYAKYELLETMQPYQYGGGSNARYDACGEISLKKAPAKFETGTPAIEAVLGLGAALDYLNNLGMDELLKYEQSLHAYMIEKMNDLENIVIYNENADCGIVTFNVKGIFSQDVASYLNSQNIAVRSGHHCSKIIGDVIGSGDTLRASIYFYNTKEEIDSFVEILKETTLEKCIDLFI